MKFDFVITDTMIGQTIGPKDGFLVSLEITTTPTKYEVPEWSESKLCWRKGYLQLRGSRDSQNIYCASPHQWGYLSKLLVSNQSLGFRGDLTIKCVPLGAVFSITLSDVAIDTNQAAPADLASYGEALVATVMREQAEREAWMKNLHKGPRAEREFPPPREPVPVRR